MQVKFGFSFKIEEKGSSTHQKAAMVLSLEDPGIANWLDPMGNTIGYVVSRNYGAKTPTVPKITRVPLAQLTDHLPADSTFVSTQQRTESLHRKRVAQTGPHAYLAPPPYCVAALWILAATAPRMPSMVNARRRDALPGESAHALHDLFKIDGNRRSSIEGGRTINASSGRGRSDPTSSVRRRSDYHVEVAGTYLRTV